MGGCSFNDVTLRWRDNAFFFVVFFFYLEINEDLVFLLLFSFLFFFLCVCVCVCVGGGGVCSFSDSVEINTERLSPTQRENARFLDVETLPEGSRYPLLQKCSFSGLRDTPRG